MRIKNLLKDNIKIKAIAILITISIAILSLIKIGPQPIQINNLDKYEHALAYFVLTFFSPFTTVVTCRRIFDPLVAAPVCSSCITPGSSL